MNACTPQEFLEQLHQGLIRHTQSCLADDVAMFLVDRLDEEVGEHVGAAAAAQHRRAGDQHAEAVESRGHPP
ncbi:hypothetical protein [Streptomyces sioyaensis]|uniref:hypothetical protein n=1 Tax=Streptomyces sioyaensis TaxID=67364 RepID=UPI0037A7705C